ncbi:MAG TPA: DUF5011 domain-containing protein, partial [Bacteroidia bacterium]|nr:DUF5011 domain-containing protein [Bacteroidia bacterium]
MKKLIISLSFATMMLSIAFFTSCSKDDTTPPIVTLLGDASIELSLNTASWTDPGATATDDEDGTVSVSSDNSSSNPNLNLVGTYTVTYTAVDAAGNVGTAVRTIRVKNDAEGFAGTYAVHDTCPGFVFNYTQVITIDETLNNRVHFNKFADYANNTGIYANRLGNGSLTSLHKLVLQSVQVPDHAT